MNRLLYLVFIFCLSNTFCQVKVDYYNDSLGYFEKHVSISTSSSFIHKVDEKNKAYNDDHSAFFFIPKIEYDKPSPYNTEIIASSYNRFYMIKLKHIASYQPTLMWINNKLLFCRVWLGRTIAINFILDIVSGKVIYKEIEDYLNQAFQNQK
jgi:hypothetical protein